MICDRQMDRYIDGQITMGKTIFVSKRCGRHNKSRLWFFCNGFFDYYSVLYVQATDDCVRQR